MSSLKRSDTNLDRNSIFEHVSITIVLLQPLCGLRLSARHVASSRLASVSTSMRRKAGADTKPQASGYKVPPNPAAIDYRQHPELYKVAKGEQGVLTVEPYKSEILPHWRFRSALSTSHFY